MLLLVCLCALFTASCGWRLRGSTDLPEQLKSVSIDNQSSDSEYKSVLEKYLKSAGATVNNDINAESGKAISVIVIQSVDYDKRLLAKDEDGNPSKYELSANIKFSVSTRNPKDSIPLQSITKSARFNFDPDNVMGKSAEEKRLKSLIFEEIAGLMIRRIASQLKTQNSLKGNNRAD